MYVCMSISLPRSGTRSTTECRGVSRIDLVTDSCGKIPTSSETGRVANSFTGFWTNGCANGCISTCCVCRVSGVGLMNLFTWPTFLISRFSPPSLYGSQSYVVYSLFFFLCLLLLHLTLQLLYCTCIGPLQLGKLEDFNFWTLPYMRTCRYIYSQTKQNKRKLQLLNLTKLIQTEYIYIYSAAPPFAVSAHCFFLFASWSPAC